MGLQRIVAAFRIKAGFGFSDFAKSVRIYNNNPDMRVHLQPQNNSNLALVVYA